MTQFTDPIEVQAEPELMAARRAFPVAQSLLGGGTLRSAGTLRVGWFGTEVHPESGAVAVVRLGAGQDDLVGEVIGVRTVEPGRVWEVVAYVVGAASIEDDLDLSLSRRAFLAVAPLWREAISAEVRVIA